MSEKTFNTKFGEILLRKAVFDMDGTNLESGIEIKLDDELIAEVVDSYFDFEDEDTTIEEVEDFVEKYVDAMYER